jgi:SAM-dependent methyltransferase
MKGSNGRQRNLDARPIERGGMPSSYTGDTAGAQRTFDHRAVGYPSHDWHRDLANALSSAMPVDVRGPLVDVGTGTGNVLSAIAKHRDIGRSIGVDVSREMLQRARLRSDLHSVHFVQADASGLRCIAGSSVGTLTCSTALQYISPEETLQNVGRVLLPGGHFYCVAIGQRQPPPFAVFQDAVEQHGVRMPDPSSECGDPEWVISKLDQGNVRDAKVRPLKVRMNITEAESAWLLNHDQYASQLDTLSDESLRALRDEYMGWIQANGPDFEVDAFLIDCAAPQDDPSVDVS